MKRVLVLLASLGVLATGCGSSTSPSDSSQQPPASSGPTPSSATFTVPMSAKNENPSITNGDAGISGTGTIVLNTIKDGAGNVMSATANFQVSASGFPSGSTVNMAHIHSGGSTSNGGVVVNIGLGPSDFTIANGAGSATKNGVSVPPDIAQAILRNPSAYYFNVHTLLNPDGAFRGQLGTGAGSGGDPSPPAPAPGY